MGFKHLVVGNFKDGVNVDELIQGVKKMADEIEVIQSFEWGTEVGGEFSRGFTHAFTINFASKEDFIAYTEHPLRNALIPNILGAFETMVELDFPVNHYTPARGA